MNLERLHEELDHEIRWQGIDKDYITEELAVHIVRAAYESYRMFLCLDCQVDTSEIGEYYMVHFELWRKINPADKGMLCIGCVEERLGRFLIPTDFLDAPINYKTHDDKSSDRLKARLGVTKTKGFNATAS